MKKIVNLFYLVSKYIMKIYFVYFLVRLVVSGNNLIISSAQQSDEGRYQCIARNIAGVRHSTQALLSVYGELSRTH